jgi:hypothetical protein
VITRLPDGGHFLRRDWMDTSSPARLYCTLVGGVLVIAGIIGFFYNANFGSGSDVVGDDTSFEVFGILAVNGWHNLVHLGIGVILLVAANSNAREAALGIGLLYVALAIWGFLEAEEGYGIIFFDLVPINTEDNWLHVILGLTGLAAGAATPAGRTTAAAPPPAAL